MWYHMMGTGMGSLNVYLTTSTQDLLFSKSFDHGADLWFETGAFIGAQTNFSIQIEGRKTPFCLTLLAH